MQERTTSTGLAVVEHRALRPPVTPNDTVPPESDPGTVGVADTVIPGDPNGVELVDSPPAPPWPPSIIRPTPWSGWPTEWDTPNWWGRVEALTDTAWMCIDLNSSLLSTMPPYLVDAAPSLDADWLTNPDPTVYTCWEEFAKQLFWDYHLGEAFVVATAYYVTGWPARFHVVPPWMVNVEMDAGRRVYSIGTLDVTGDILHIRYQSRVDDAHGHGPLEVGRARMVAAAALMRYGSALASAGGIPPSILTHPDELTAKQSTDLQNQWVIARMAGLGLPAVLSGGVKWEPTQVNPRDMALLELSQFTDSRIAVLLGVPPFLVGLPSGGDSMTYSNVVSLFDYHWRAGLRPKAASVMPALSGWALPRGTTIEVNRDEYIKPGPYERAQTWQILIDLGVLTVEQVQEMERYSVASPSQTLTSGVLQ